MTGLSGLQNKKGEGRGGRGGRGYEVKKEIENKGGVGGWI